MIRRNSEQIRGHYKIEKELANRLRNADARQRCSLYTIVYDELLCRVPHHPHLVHKQSKEFVDQSTNRQLKLLQHFINENTVFLEIGSGDCSLSLRVAKYVKHVYAVDVSHEIVKEIPKPANFQLSISDGSSIPVPKGSINVAYSNQLMEHLHPDDALRQLTNIYDSLADNGIYICQTPNRISGPHDISKHFDDIATGLHLKEYTIQELFDLFQKVAFSKVKVFVGGKGVFMPFPLRLALLCEGVLNLLPIRFRKLLAKFIFVRAILGIKIIAFK